jgi:hypothetical protein
MASVVPFPLTRRRDFIRRHVSRMALRPAAEAEKHLAYLLRVQVETMSRRGIAADLISAQIRALETAVRCELRRVTIRGDGTA